MSGPSNVQELPLTDKRQLVEFHAAGARPREQWTIGTEHEKFGFRLDDLRPPTYDGPQGIEAMLRGMTRFGWQPVEEKGKLIALTRDGGSITLTTGVLAREPIATGAEGEGAAREETLLH